ncbi:tRNA dimethylallyltransferase [Spirochaetia bacterium]|nr:tRNA dimethylallyltransferase [Spirochaetia bacterium]
MPIPVLLLFGPTASGKTEVLETLFTGKNAACPAEIISADSMQVYRGMDIGTAKPGAELTARLPHHLIDILSPNEQFNVGEFVRLADRAAAGIAARGKLPVISGGTGFYLTNFVMGLPETPLSDPDLRQSLQDELRRRGPAALMAELAACDPVSARRIHPNDTYRILRALEVYRLSGRPLSGFPRPGISAAAPAPDIPAARGTPAIPAGTDAPAAPPAFRPGYRFLLIGLDRPRPDVYRRINDRCAEMFRSGLPAEVRRLYEAGYAPPDPGMRAIGYQEFFIASESGNADRDSANKAACKAAISADLAAVETLVARNSRRYAKRQITYFASLPEVVWVPAADNPAVRIRELLGEFLGSGRHNS